VDPDNNILSYNWDLDNDGQFDDATGKTPKFAVVDNGIYTVRVKVTDTGGLSSIAGSTVIARNVPPVITSWSFSGLTRVGLQLNALAKFKDAGVNDTFTGVWKWGDGMTSTGTVSGNIVSGSHTYVRTGFYLVTVTITDKDGGVGRSYRLILVYPKR
jgi:PKD repeat protein